MLTYKSSFVKSLLIKAVTHFDLLVTFVVVVGNGAVPINYFLVVIVVTPIIAKLILLL